MIELSNNTIIPDDDLTFKFSRSSGPGGQNVNKVSTSATVYFDLAGTDALDDQQKSRIRKKLASRINKEGQMWVVSQRFRTQNANRRAAIERLTERLNQALTKKKYRKKTEIPYAARQKRLIEKKQRSELKKLRSNRVSEQ